MKRPTIRLICLTAILFVGLPILAYWRDESNLRQQDMTHSSAALLIKGDDGWSDHCSAVAFERRGDTVYLATAKHCLVHDTSEDFFGFGKKNLVRTPDSDLTICFSENGKGPYYPLIGSVVSKTDDVAILGIANTEAVSVATVGSDPRERANLEAVTFPMDLGRTQTDGEVLKSILRATEKRDWVRTMATELLVAPGSSGGGVFDASHRLVGIVVASLSGTDIAFIEPISTIKNLRKTLK